MGDGQSKPLSKKQGINERLSHASKTGVLALQDLKLVHVPPGVQQLQERLRSLTLERNKLAEVPGWLGVFKTLKTLNLDNNVCSDLPAELSQIKKLDTLSLASNRFLHFPTCLYSMRFLKTLNLANNQITLLPKEICQLPKLDVLDLTGNKLAALPAECAELKTHELILNRNQIARIPAELGKAVNLKVLRIEENCVDKSGLPAELLRDSKLVLIAFDGNVLTQRQFQGIAGHDQYSARFTATKMKM